MALLDERAHKAEKESQKQRADVRAVDVGIGHEDDLAVAELGDVKVLAKARAEGGDHGGQLVVAIDAVEARLLDVEHLAPERQDGLIAAVAPLLGRAARRVALDDIDLGQGRVALLAVGQLARQRVGLERRLAAGHLARLARGLSRAGGGLRLVDDGAGDGRVFLEEDGQALAHHGLDQGAHVAVAELGLGLALELCVLQLDRDDDGQPLAHVVARKVLLVLLDEVVLAAVVVEHLGQGRLEAGLVRAALGGLDVVGEREHKLVVGIGVLHGDLGHAGLAGALHVDDIRMDGRLALV